MTRHPATRPRRRLGLDAVAVVVALACYLLLATRGEVVAWVLP